MNYRLTLPEMTIEGETPEGVLAILDGALHHGVGMPLRLPVIDEHLVAEPDEIRITREKAEADKICWSTGPKVGGEDGYPYCAEPLGHSGLHKPDPGCGWGNISWGSPSMRAADHIRYEGIE